MNVRETRGTGIEALSPAGAAQGWSTPIPADYPRVEGMRNIGLHVYARQLFVVCFEGEKLRRARPRRMPLSSDTANEDAYLAWVLQTTGNVKFFHGGEHDQRGMLARIKSLPSRRTRTGTHSRLHHYIHPSRVINLN